MEDHYQIHLSRLLKFGTITLMDYDREMGKHSGYPECCINAFITSWRHNISASQFLRSAYGENGKGHVGYVQCPKCRLPGTKEEANEARKEFKETSDKHRYLIGHYE